MTRAGWLTVPVLLPLSVVLPASVVPPPPVPPAPVIPPAPVGPPPAQAPLAQVCSAEHTTQLDPQCAESVLELHVPSAHIVLFEWQDDTHCPSSQTSPLAHTVQLAPQWAVFDETHAPLHATSPPAHAHTPAWQAVPVLHETPQAPQFSLSLMTSTQVPLHSSCADVQVDRVLPPFVQSAAGMVRTRTMTDRSTTFIALQFPARAPPIITFDCVCRTPTARRCSSTGIDVTLGRRSAQTGAARVVRSGTGGVGCSRLVTKFVAVVSYRAGRRYLQRREECHG